MKFILTSDTHYGISEKTPDIHIRFWKEVQETIEKENVTALIWAGDLISCYQRDLEKTISMAREYVTIPILLVRGNHDLWDRRHKKDKSSGMVRTITRLDQEHDALFRKYGVYHLERGPYTIGDVIILGWDGWYGTAFPGTNDQFNMKGYVEGCETGIYLSNQAWKKFEALLDVDLTAFRKSICVTHMPTYPTHIEYNKMCANFKFHDMIKDKFDILCCGHNHWKTEHLDDKLRVINAGSDYDIPRYILFDV